MTEVLVDAILDTLPILPFLFIVYVLIELIERRLMFASRAKKLLRGKFAPLIGTGVGLIPQCGFSVMATNLYLSNNLTIGTLVAVFIATSDEAIPILLTDATSALHMLPMLALKILFALFMGYLLDFIFKKRNAERLALSEVTPVTVETETGCCHHKLEHEEGKKQNKKEILKDYLLHPFVHSIKVFLYIFVITLLFGILIYYVGQDKISAFMAKSGWYQPFVTALVGLIPNCAASVIIAQLYVLKGITFGSCFAGLSVNAGIALALLFKRNSDVKESIIILLTLYLSSVVMGLALTPIPW